MTRSLPDKPSLRFLQTQAKDLLKDHARKDPAVCATLRLLRRFRAASDAEALYLLAAWDDTDFGNNQSSTGLLNYELDGETYQITFRVQGAGGTPQVTMQAIERCLQGSDEDRAARVTAMSHETWEAKLEVIHAALGQDRKE